MHVSTVYRHSYTVVIRLCKSNRTQCLEQAYTCEKWKVHKKYSSESQNGKHHYSNKYRSMDNIKLDFEESVVLVYLILDRKN